MTESPPFVPTPLPPPDGRRRVLVLHTGGTIGMVASPGGYRPAAGFPERLRSALQATGSHGLPAFDVLELDPIDSAELRPSDWTAMARALVNHWDRYDGFVVLHGTDTMAWSASALSFLLRGLDKPVIFTGSQIPMGQARSDGLANVESALLLAAMPELREVGLCFGRRLLRGNRARKLATAQFDAFDSPNALPLAELGIDIHLHRDRLWTGTEPRRFAVPAFDDEAVAVLALHPGVSAGAVDALVAQPRVRGLVLHSYGAGNVPANDRGFMAALERAAARGVVLVNVTQCLQGSVQQGAYATGTALGALGAVPAGDMTPEAAFAKLHVLLASTADTGEVRRGMGESWCGEMGS